MISAILYALERSIKYIRSHPQILFALIWVLLIPLLFLYSGQQFLDAARNNQDRIEKNQIGILHDVFKSLVGVAVVEPELLQTQIDELAELNPDILSFLVAEVRSQQIVPIVSLDRSLVGIAIDDPTLFQNAALRNDESIIFEFYVNGNRVWQAFRAFQTPLGTQYFIFTEHSLANTDDATASNKNSAYWSLLIIYIVVLALAYWQLRNTNYIYLYDEAKKANETKDLFTNMIAHELRAPLTAMRGYASMISESKTADTTSRQYADKIKQATERLLIIVSDLLDVARIQSGKLSVTKASADLSVIINAAAEELRVSAQQKNITLLCTGTEVATEAIIDGKRLHQALTNLISNSIKYTKEGKIEISLENRIDAHEIRIKDTGMGIAAADQKQLFAPFYRVESDDVSQITGTGLGMWITRQLLELMGARIEVESIKGVGTHIVITIRKS